MTTLTEPTRDTLRIVEAAQASRLRAHTLRHYERKIDIHRERLGRS